MLNCSLKALLSEKESNLCCFGAGNYFQAFLDESIGMGIDPCIQYIVDNNANRIKRIGRYEVISVEEFLNRVTPNIKIIITTAYYQEVRDQLCEYKALDSVECFAYPLMQIYQENNQDNIKRDTEEPCIPKVIHYCWFGKTEKPERDERCIASWKKYCPDYQIIEWNEDNYDITQCSYIEEAYQRKKWAFVSDYARFDIVNRYGGFYFDTDVELIKSIEELRYHKAFIGVEAAGGIASGLGFGSIKNITIWDEILNLYQNTDFLNSDGSIKMVANASYETSVFKIYGFKRDNKFQMIKEVAVYPSEYFCPKIVGTDIIKSTEKTYSIHHYHYSWRD